MEEKIAQEIVEDIKNSIREALASLYGADSDYYRKFYQYFHIQQKKLAKLCGLPQYVIEEIVALVSNEEIVPIGKKLLEENVQYNTAENIGSSGLRERDQVRVKEKEKEEESEEEQQDKEDELQEEFNADILAKMASKKQQKDAKEILKRVLICMIAARMDPRRRAGESVQSNARHAEIYGRENRVSLKDLVKAGVVGSAVLARLKDQGISGNASLSVTKIQSFVAAQYESIVNLIRGESFGHSATRIPGKSQGLLTLSNVKSSLGIFSGVASNIGVSTNLSPGFSPFVESQSKGDVRGR